MNIAVKKLMDHAINVVSKSEGSAKDLRIAVVEQIDIRLGSRLPAELLELVKELDINVGSKVKLGDLLSKVKAAVFKELRVKQFPDGDFSILRDSPIPVPEPVMTNQEETTMPAKSTSKKSAKKSAPRKTTGRTTGSRLSTYSLGITKAQLKKLEGYSPQALGIMQAVSECGGKNVDRQDLLASMPNYVESKQPMSSILSFYQKKLIADGLLKAE